MKFSAKHPAGQAYELSREEMHQPEMIRQLGINKLWMVKNGSEWIPMGEFLALPAGQLQKSQAADPLLAAGAPWSPGSVFALVLRLLGLYLVFEVFRSLLNDISGLLTTPEVIPTPWLVVLPIALSYGAYLIVGLYLLAGPRALLAWIFRPA